MIPDRDEESLREIEHELRHAAPDTPRPDEGFMLPALRRAYELGRAGSEDAARLDWIEAHVRGEEQPHPIEWGPRSLREAIDAARAGEEK